VRAPKIDKHSTGGVGDKISLCLAPLVAAAGAFVPMISGRGLGHTGGTLDKLEAIPGYRTRLSERRFVRIVETVGCSIIGATKHIAPADRLMYALRDVTGTVASIPLIVASILSKKIAAGIHALVLDVKVGDAAFMKNSRDARALSRMLVEVGSHAGKSVRAIITEMDAPIGTSIGNALEVREAIDVLYGAGPEDTVELTVELGAEMLLLSEVATSRADGRRRMERAIADGSGLERFRRMVEAHGGDPRVVDDPTRLPRAPRRLTVSADRAGIVQRIDGYALGLLSLALGAGRTRADLPVDSAVGIEVLAQRGQRVERGDRLATLHVRTSKKSKTWHERALSAFTLGRRAPKVEPRVLARLAPARARTSR
jgi:pyrimidine-nucleoside phosphorylase